MPQWYDEEMPGQRCPYSRTEDEARRNLEETLEWERNNPKPKKRPEENTFYKHHNGLVYEVLFITNEGSTNPDYPETVVYEGINGKKWSKTLDNFLQKMTRL